MRRLSIIFGVVAMIALLGVLAATTLAANNQDEEMMVEVSLTNLTRGQLLSPVFVARHDGNAGPLYSLGEAASDDLAKLAEDADPSGLQEAWDPDDNDDVAETSWVAFNSGAIPPGETVTMNFDIDDGKSLLSFASMLVSTNDAFIGANHLDVSKSRTMMLNVYDAGTEANSEDCAFIPGPPCGKHVHDPADAEGFIYVHAGIHGGSGSGLDAATHDWRNPAARLTIKTWKISR